MLPKVEPIGIKKVSHPVDVHVGRKLKELRLMRGKTQTEVADSLTTLNMMLSQWAAMPTGGESDIVESVENYGAVVPYVLDGCVCV
jgi:hypothetical protein